MVRGEVAGRENQFLEEKNVPESGQRVVTFLHVNPLIAIIFGPTGPVVIVARGNRPGLSTSQFLQNIEEESALRRWRRRKTVVRLNVLLMTLWWWS